MKRIALLIIIVMLVAFASVAVAQTDVTITQGQFAKSLVKRLQWERYLGITAATEWDYIALLEQMGVSPLEGWKKDAPVNQDAIVTVYALLMDHEDVVFEKAQLVCDRNVQIINFAWDQMQKILQRDVTLDMVLADTKLFPNGAPKCPYGHTYKDLDGNGFVDFHIHRARKKLGIPESNVGDFEKQLKGELGESEELDERKVQQEQKGKLKPQNPEGKVQKYLGDIELLKK